MTFDDKLPQQWIHCLPITCKLNHPNTVAIYDYGRTPEGVFYYAMEYLDGIDLQTLVDRYGVQPEGRVSRILQQMCGSLFEAHSHGLVHRDIKPANVMLNRRGGEPDVIKVLDFGLVKDLDDDKKTLHTAGLAGNPVVHVAGSDPGTRYRRCSQRYLFRGRGRLFPSDGPMRSTLPTPSARAWKS